MARRVFLIPIYTATSLLLWKKEDGDDEEKNDGRD
jgi:hypothetical protein